MRSAKILPKATWSARKENATVPVSCMGHEQPLKGAPDCVSETRSCSRWAYGDQWAEEEVERELAETTGSLEKLAGVEEEESGSSVHGSENCLREY